MNERGRRLRSRIGAEQAGDPFISQGWDCPSAGIEALASCSFVSQLKHFGA